MPLELGVFFGAKRFGGKYQKAKRCIVLDKSRFRYQKFISDIAGQDVHAHQQKMEALISVLAGWLRDEGRDPIVPGGKRMTAEFATFVKELPKICAKRHLEADELTMGDYTEMIAEYITVIT
jgi:hypothetical protein